MATPNLPDSVKVELLLLHREAILVENKLKNIIDSIQAKIGRVLKEAKLKETEYLVDLNSLTFVKKEQPKPVAAEAPAAESDTGK